MQTRSANMIYGSMILLECAIWGVANAAYKIALISFPPFYCMALRFLLGFPVLFAIDRGRFFSRVNARNLPGILRIAAASSVTYILSAFGLLLTSATTAGFLMSLAVLFTPFLAFLFTGKFNRRIMPVIAIVIVGMYLLCDNSGDFSFGLGETFCLLSSGTAALTLVFTSAYITQSDPITISAAQSLSAAVITLTCALLFERAPAFTAVPGEAWWSILYLAIGSTVIAYLLQNIALKHLSAIFVSLAFSTEPIFTAIAAYFMLGEVLHRTGFIGAGLITAGVVAASLMQQKE